MNYNNYKIKTKIIIFLLNILISGFYSALRLHLEMPIAYLIYFFISIFIFCIIKKIKLLYGTIIISLANAFTLISMFIATIITFLLTKFVLSVNIRETIIEYIAIGVVQLLLLYLFFRIKRFKNGFSFLKNNSCNMANITGGISSAIIIVMYLLYVIFANDFLRSVLVFALILGGIVIFNWIKNSITKYYKLKMRDRTVELQAEQLKEKDEIINNLKEELSNALKINHKYNHRLSSMEKIVSKFGEKAVFNEEFAEEYADLLDSLNNLSKEYREELYNSSNNLPKTNIFSVDNLLEYMNSQAIKDKIDFSLELHGDINYMVDKIIPNNKLETMLGDHIRDAIIAINSSENNNKNILVVLGNKDKYYELCIYDTGIEFEIDTLLKLGLEQITTHKETGGSGIGFMTTFETMKECKASLIIEEYPINNKYTKSITIRFDGLDEYRIISYRADKIKALCKDERIIINNN